VPVLYDIHRGDPTKEDLRRRLEKAWPDPGRVAAAVALREALVLPVDPDKLDWDFTEPMDRRGWMPVDGMTVLPGAKGLGFCAADDNPWVAGPGLWLDAETIAGLRITMRTHNPDYPVEGGEGQVYWLTDEDMALEESRSFAFPIRNEDGAQDYRVPLGDAPNWPTSGRIVFLRLDPANGPCEFEVLRLSVELR
jgi:hypothetical protein